MRRYSMHTRIALLVLAAMMFVGGVAACGKRGEPYRPNEVEQSGS